VKVARTVLRRAAAGNRCRLSDLTLLVFVLIRILFISISHTFTHVNNKQFHTSHNV
jgi:hypothetical protein